KPGVSVEAYEKDLGAFTRGLLNCGCPGLRSASSFRISAVPWLGDRDGYEDWAIVDELGVLERLNVAAVSGAMAPLHGRVADAMNAGHGGVYYRLWGELAPPDAGAAQWITRPRGVTYGPILQAIAESAGQPVSVWRRFMVLGPGREFLVLGETALSLRLPPDWAAHPVRRSTVPLGSCDVFP
ncbi:MAG: hypothetical protein J0H62_06000, partial [Rhizobiales bacterium]|nr:hypothetical protein [Hyphomicrobiales bacterium]